MLVVAGCVREDPPPPATTATPFGTPTAASPEPTATPAPTPEPTPRTPLAPKVVFEQTFDFASEGDPTGQDPRIRTSERVAEEYANFTINVTIVRSSAAPTGLPVSGTINSPTVRVLDPDGVEVLVETREGAAREETVPAVPGVWTVRFEGAGTLKATVTLTARG